MANSAVNLFCSVRSVALMSVLAMACSASFAGGGHGHGHGHDDEHEYKHDHGHKDKHDKKKYHHDDHGERRVEYSKTREVDRYDTRTGDVRVGQYFDDRRRHLARSYYGEQFRTGNCPPGLAKKDNGCRPPGQVRSYVMGQRLPASVVYYSVPQPVIAQIGLPPSGYRYVRVASDILLLSVGTSMVVDAIQDLGGL